MLSFDWIACNFHMLNRQKEVEIFQLSELINPYHVSRLFLYLLKTFEN